MVYFNVINCKFHSEIESVTFTVKIDSGTKPIKNLWVKVISHNERMHFTKFFVLQFSLSGLLSAIKIMNKLIHIKCINDYWILPLLVHYNFKYVEIVCLNWM